LTDPPTDSDRGSLDSEKNPIDFIEKFACSFLNLLAQEMRENEKSLTSLLE